METATQRIAREINIMNGSGGPLSRSDWAAHLAQALGELHPLPESELAALADLLDGSLARAHRFVEGLEVMCSSFAANSDSPFWARESRQRTLVSDALTALAVLWGGPSSAP